MTFPIFNRSHLDTTRSTLLDRVTPEYPIGECYAKHSVGQDRCIDNVADAYQDQDWWGLDYCQGWHIRVWKDKSADAFTHGFLVENLWGEEPQDGDPLLVDALAACHYCQDYTPFWVPVQRWNRIAQERFFSSLTADGDDSPRWHWPLTGTSDPRWDFTARQEPSLRWGYLRALRQASAALGVPINA